MNLLRFGETEPERQVSQEILGKLAENESYVSYERSHLSLNRPSCDGCPLPTLGFYRSLIGSRHCWPIKIAGLSLPFYLHPFTSI